MCLRFFKRCVFFKMSNNGTFEISQGPDNTPPPKKVTDREPLINRSNPMEGGFFNGIFRPCFAEFFGMMLFVFIGTMSVAGTGAALAHGLALAVLIASTCKIRWVLDDKTVKKFLFLFLSCCLCLSVCLFQPI